MDAATARRLSERAGRSTATSSSQCARRSRPRHRDVVATRSGDAGIRRARLTCAVRDRAMRCVKLSSDRRRRVRHRLRPRGSAAARLGMAATWRHARGTHNATVSRGRNGRARRREFLVRSPPKEIHAPDLCFAASRSRCLCRSGAASRRTRAAARTGRTRARSGAGPRSPHPWSSRRSRA